MPAENGKPDNIATTVTQVSEQVSLLVREEVELAKAEVTRKASSIARGAAAVAAGAVFGVFAVIFGLLTLSWWLNDILGSLWEGFLIVFGVLILATMLTFVFAWRKLRVGAPTPQMAIDEARKIQQTVSSKAEGDA